jgi:crotonobetainyl-CoA:carnitine CoA-transferase CaiB-like acyl-CoA transferase
MGLLGGIRVVEMAGGVAGPYASKLLNDLGADVVRLHRPANSGSNQGYDPDICDNSALGAHLSQGKKILDAELEDDAAASLFAETDIAILGAETTPKDVVALRHSHPHLVVTTITPWGLTGPWAGRPASDLVVQAESGAVGHHGRLDQVPYRTGGRLIDWCAGTVAASASLGAILHHGPTGSGEHVDVSILATATFASIAFVDVRHQLEGCPLIVRPARIIDAPSIEPTRDGWVAFATNTIAQVHQFLEMVERADLIGTDWELSEYRIAHLDEWNGLIHPWLKSQSTNRILELAESRRIPAAPVLDGKGLIDCPQAVAADLLEQAGGVQFTRPASPFRINGERPVPNSTDVINSNGSASSSVGVDTGRVNRPVLEGIRVLDATTFFAGPSLGELLALLGADVIHLESCSQMDGSRNILGVLADTELSWERSGMWQSCNRGKRSLAVALDVDEGQGLIRKLVEECDVMIDNFAPRVFDRFGFDHEAVQSMNSSIIHVRMPAFGLDGPWRDHVGFAQTLEAASGIAWRTGHPYDQPRIARGPADPLAGWHAAVAVLAALVSRQPGVGVAIESSMFDAAVSVSAELIVEWSANQRDLGRGGDPDADIVPDGVFACAGDENWLALSVFTDDQWQSLVTAFDGSPWCDMPELALVQGRRERRELLEEQLAAQFVKCDLEDVLARLLTLGIPAGRVRDPRLSPHHPQLQGFGYYETTNHPVVGSLQVPALPFRFASVDRWSDGRAPLLGEHNHEVLRELVGLTAKHIEQLEQAGVIGHEPVSRQR